MRDSIHWSLTAAALGAVIIAITPRCVSYHAASPDPDGNIYVAWSSWFSSGVMRCRDKGSRLDCGDLDVVDAESPPTLGAPALTGWAAPRPQPSGATAAAGEVSPIPDISSAELTENILTLGTVDAMGSAAAVLTPHVGHPVAVDLTDGTERIGVLRVVGPTSLRLVASTGASVTVEYAEAKAVRARPAAP